LCRKKLIREGWNKVRAMEDKSIFEENEERVSRNMMRYIKYLVVVYPLILVLDLLKVFEIGIVPIAIFTVLGILFTQIPEFLFKKGKITITQAKYLIVFSVMFIVATMGMDWHIGIYMTYTISMIISIVYFDTKFTRITAYMSYVMIVISLYVRSIRIEQIEFKSNLMWFFSRSLGFLMEWVAVTIICCAVTSISRYLLLKLDDERKRNTNLITMMRELEERKFELESQSIYDDLTGMYNKNGFYEKLEKITKKAEDGNIDFFLVSFDMSGLKSINDLHGHAEGDKALKKFSEILDNATNDTYEITCRFNGGAFVMAGASKSAEMRCDMLRKELREKIAKTNSKYKFGINMGYAVAEAGEKIDVKSLFAEADRKMFEEKREKDVEMEQKILGI